MVVGLQRAWRYDVCLSFRGSDVRKDFVDHLYRALTVNKYPCFPRDHKVKKSQNINPTIKHAIECSRIRIPIFSPDFATSVCCLNEVPVNANQVQRTAIPLFYKMTPSQVRHPERPCSPYAEAFQHYRSTGIHSPEEIETWKNAFHTLSKPAGWTLDDTNGYGAALVKLVVEDVREHFKVR